MCKLKKSFFGSNSHLEHWFRRFAEELKIQEYYKKKLDHTIFFQQSRDGMKTVLIVGMDDIILTWDKITEMESLKRCLAAKFKVKDLGQCGTSWGWRLQDQRRMLLYPNKSTISIC